MNGPNEMPQLPGETPIPEGHIRLYHYTHPDNIPSIRQHGLDATKARGDGGMGYGNEPSAGIWASTRKPNDDALHRMPHVEFHAHPDQISQNAEHFWHQDPHEWANGYHHVIMRGSVPPHQIAAIHEPWHSGVRYMQEGGGPEKYEWVRHQTDPEYAQYHRAFEYFDRQKKQANNPKADKNWRPTQRMFAPGKEDLDPRLFNGDEIRADFRNRVLADLNRFWGPRYGDWKRWAKVYLAGGEASHWYNDHNDIDILIGVDYHKLGESRPAFRGLNHGAISKRFNDEFRRGLNSSHFRYAGDTWERTFYVNPDSYDIRRIKPYAAYDLTDNEWAVKPFEAGPTWGPQNINPAVWHMVEHSIRHVRHILNDLKGFAQQSQAKSYYEYLHNDRSRAFGPFGDGLVDRGNVILKALDMHPDHLLERLIEASKGGVYPGRKQAELAPGFTYHHLNHLGREEPPPSQEQIWQRHTGGDDDDVDFPEYEHQLRHNGKPVARLSYSVFGHEPTALSVNGMATHKKYQGAGHATALQLKLQEQAQQHGQTIFHGGRTPHGHAWWQSFKQHPQFDPKVHDMEEDYHPQDYDPEEVYKGAFPREGKRRLFSLDWKRGKRVVIKQNDFPAHDDPDWDHYYLP